MIEELLVLFTNIHFQSALFAYIIAQVLKYFIGAFVYTFSSKEMRQELDSKKNNASFASYIVRNGGMPSSHCASASALCMSLALAEGTTSTSFLVALFFTSVLVSDAIGVRRQVGVIGDIINTIIDKHNKSCADSNNTKDILYSIKVVYGHTPSEAFVGVMLGMVIARLYYVVYAL